MKALLRTTDIHADHDGTGLMLIHTDSRARRDARYTFFILYTLQDLSRWLFYQRMCQAGKAKKLALTACMRKLLTILN